MRGLTGSWRRTTRRLVAVAAAALSLSAATNATAQYNKTEPPQTRFRIGPLRFSPRLELTNAGRDSNVFLDPTNPLADTSIVVRATVEGFVPVRRRARLFGEGWLAGSANALQLNAGGQRGRTANFIQPLTKAVGEREPLESASPSHVISRAV